MTQFAEQLHFFLSVDHNCIFFVCCKCQWPVRWCCGLSRLQWLSRPPGGEGFAAGIHAEEAAGWPAKGALTWMNVVLHWKKWGGKKTKKHFLMISTGESAVGKYFLKGLCSWSETICIFWCSSFFVYLHKSSQHSVISSHRWLLVEEDWKHQEHLNLSLASL